MSAKIRGGTPEGKPTNAENNVERKKGTRGNDGNVENDLGIPSIDRDDWNYPRESGLVTRSRQCRRTGRN